VTYDVNDPEARVVGGSRAFRMHPALEVFFVVLLITFNLPRRLPNHSRNTTVTGTLLAVEEGCAGNNLRRGEHLRD
jgi:hypothetical protein